MFTSKEDLKLNYGVDMEIGKFFVDRKVPADNFYWKDRYLYINPMPGYLFIPIYADLQFRIGIPKKELLTDGYAGLVERVLDIIGKEEFTGQTHREHIDECASLVAPFCKNNLLLEKLASGLSSGTLTSTSLMPGLKALQRVDTYLFPLCALQFEEGLQQRLIDAWHALMNFYLILDDLDDIKDDMQTGELNSIIEAGLDNEGALVIDKVLADSYNTMNAINPVFANRMDFSLQHIDVKKIISDYWAASEKPA